jgi:DNA-binding beta-propeller fold protein YncE
VAAAGSRLFVGDMGGAQVLVLDLAGKVLATVPVPSNPHEMAVSADQSLVAVASRGRNNPDDYQLPGPDFGRVTLLNAKGEVLGTTWGRNQPMGLAFSPDGKFLAFTDFLDNNVELYRVTK